MKRILLVLIVTLVSGSGLFAQGTKKGEILNSDLSPASQTLANISAFKTVYSEKYGLWASAIQELRGDGTNPNAITVTVRDGTLNPAGVYEIASMVQGLRSIRFSTSQKDTLIVTYDVETYSEDETGATDGIVEVEKKRVRIKFLRDQDGNLNGKAEIK